MLVGARSSVAPSVRAPEPWRARHQPPADVLPDMWWLPEHRHSCTLLLTSLGRRLGTILGLGWVAAGSTILTEPGIGVIALTGGPAGAADRYAGIDAGDGTQRQRSRPPGGFSFIGRGQRGGGLESLPLSERPVLSFGAPMVPGLNDGGSLLGKLSRS